MRAVIHYGQKYANAIWNGAELIFGDGDTIFTQFPASTSIVVHEMSHGLVYNTAPLIYEGQPGALSESIADVFGAAAEQWSKNQKPAEASWLVGAGCLAPGIKGVALRSMKAPGTAYNDPRIGKDPQPDYMRNYIGTTEDFGGVY